ncbi:hypothetical protein NL676_023814 [Syzygium grande]|nr:hypothetical protein NL676_023814 [Syzygium grande]
MPPAGPGRRAHGGVRRLRSESASWRVAATLRWRRPPLPGGVGRLPTKVRLLAPVSTTPPPTSGVRAALAAPVASRPSPPPRAAPTLLRQATFD